MVRIVLSALCLTTAFASCQRNRAPTFSEFVDRYLDDFARRHPSIAAGNGLHQHDDRLDDFTASGIAEEIAALQRDATTLAAFDTTALTPDERVDRLILQGIIDGWLLEQETIQNWRRNPMLYASALSDGVHNLMAMESDPAPVRMRRIISKLGQTRTLLDAARANLGNPPRLLAERGALMMKGALEMLGKDLDLAFAADSNSALKDSLRKAADTALPAIRAYVAWLEQEVIPNANGEIAIGGENVARRYRAEDMIDQPLDTLLAIGERELKVSQDEFRTAAARLAPGRDPLTAWREVRRNHPQPGGVVAATRLTVESLTSFVERKGIASIPPDERVIVEPALPFDLGFASMHASPPLEKTPVRSVYYITEPPLDMPKAEADAWLERYNYASLENTSAHEAMPGHWLHSVYMRKTPGKVRRIWIGLNPFPQPSSGQDGWRITPNRWYWTRDSPTTIRVTGWRNSAMHSLESAACSQGSACIRSNGHSTTRSGASRNRRMSQRRPRSARRSEPSTTRPTAGTSLESEAFSSFARITRHGWAPSSTCARSTSGSCRTALRRFVPTGC
jgi:hypothetical protein